jgi:Acetyltransferase (GNAT) domain
VDINQKMDVLAEPLPRAFTVQSFSSIAHVPRAEWDRMLPGEPESWDFYAAVEASPPPGFAFGVLAAFDGSQIVGVAPTFRVDYRLDTPLQGRARAATDWIYRRLPRAVSFPVIGIGSPMADNCALGFAPELSIPEIVKVFESMLVHLAEEARTNGSALMSVKSLDRSADVLDSILKKHGYGRVTSVPLVMLDLPFRDLDAYLNSLPKKTGAYLRRKMRGAEKVRIEYRTSIAGLEPAIKALFDNTLRQSKVNHGDFQELGADYFPRVVEGMGDKAQIMLCWQGSELLSFQLALFGADRLLAKQIGMKYPEARDLNLYFVNWLKLIEFAIDNKIPSIEMGATTYATKLLFGGHLERRWLHYRLRRPSANMLLGRFGSFLDFEKNDHELKALDHAAKTNMGPHTSRIERGRVGPDHVYG